MDPVGRPEYTLECYLCKRNIIIVLEHASINGYVTMDKYVPFDEEHYILLLRTLAWLYSRSLILDERFRWEGSQTILDLYGHLLNEMLFISGDDKSEDSLVSSVTAAHASSISSRSSTTTVKPSSGGGSASGSKDSAFIGAVD